MAIKVARAAIRGRPKGSICIYPGIIRDAVELGVSVSQLWRVRQGKRVNASLSAKDADLQRRKQTNPSTV